MVEEFGEGLTGQLEGKERGEEGLFPATGLGEKLFGGGEEEFHGGESSGRLVHDYISIEVIYGRRGKWRVQMECLFRVRRVMSSSS